MKAIFIDDEDVLCEFVVGLLKQYGFDTKYYSRIQDARCACAASRIDLAILDLKFPPKYEQEGFDLIPELKRNNPNMDIIMVSGCTKPMTDTVSSAYNNYEILNFVDKNSIDFKEKLEKFVWNAKEKINKKIFITHGHNDHLKLKLKDFLNNNLYRETMILSELPKRGDTIVEQLERSSKFCNYAIILLTRDDEMSDGDMRARQNVVHEIGFFQGKYGRKNVILVAEKGVDLFSNISGIRRIEFDSDHFEEVYEELRIELNNQLSL